MSASVAYIQRLEDHASDLIATNERIIERWLEVGCPADTNAWEAVRVNSAEAERFRQQALWHRNANGEVLWVRPTEPAWRD